VTIPFYVSPEQLTKDRSDFARAGVARGKAVVAAVVAEGILLVTQNASQSLHKIAEIYDRIAFAGVGKYNEFEALRRAGVRYADLRGYSYDRVDVDARGLAGAYAETLGEVFTAQPKPFEVEIALAEVGAKPQADRIFRIGFDGSVWEADAFLVIGGHADELAAALRPALAGDGGVPSLADALRVSATSLLRRPADGEHDPSAVDGLEAALLDRQAPRRAFRRLAPAEIAKLTVP
jgi:proteasome alpha subunit